MARLEVEHTLVRTGCADCGTRVFAYSTDDHGTHRCRQCTLRYNGTTVCWCGRALHANETGTLVHSDGRKYNHAATAEPTDPVYRRNLPDGVR